jgi:syntaxin-binding protein 1
MMMIYCIVLYCVAFNSAFYLSYSFRICRIFESTTRLRRSLRNRSTSDGSVDDEEESEYASSRYIPPLKGILRALVSNQLDFQEYPSVIPMPPSSTSSSVGVTSSARSSRKKGGASTDKWGKSKSSEQSKGKGSYDGGRNIVFMVGGLSFSELRVTRDVMEKQSREIIAGSTKFVSPEEFIDDLKSLV